MDDNTKNLRIVFTGETASVVAAFDAVKAKTVETAAAADTLGQKFGLTMSSTMAVPIIGIGVATAKMVSQFQQDMTYVRTDAGDTTDNINKMSDSVLNLAKSSQFGPDELAKGLYHLASLGLRGADAINALNTAQQMASVGGADLESTSTALGAALVTGIKGVQNYTEAAGTMDAIIGAGNMRMQDLVGALSTGALTVFKNAGLTLTDFGAALADLTDNGMRADEAATRLKMSISLMEAPSGKASKAMAAIGLTSTQLGMDMQSKGLIPALQELKKHLLDTYGTTDMGREKMAQSISAMFGGGRSSAAIQTLLDQLDRVQMKETQIGQQSGEFTSKLAEQQQTSSFKIKEAWSTIQSTAIELGGNVLPGVATSLAQVTAKVSQVVDWYEKLSPTMKKVLDPVAWGTGELIKAWELVDQKAIVLVNDLKILWARSSSDVQQWYTDILGWFEMVPPKVQAMREAVERELKALPGQISAPIVEAANDVKEWVSETTTDIKDWAIEIGKDIETGFKDAIRNAPQWGRDIVSGYITGMKALANYDINSLIDWGKQYVVAYESAVRFGHQLVAGIKSGWDEISRDAPIWGRDFISDIKKGFNAEVKAAEQWGHDLISSIKTGWDEISTDAPRWGREIVANVKAGFNEQVKDAIQWGRDWAHNIRKGLDDAIEDVKKFFTGLPNALDRDIRKSGTDIADKHVEGVKSTFHSVEKMDKLGQEILKGMGIATLAVAAGLALLGVSMGIALMNDISHGIEVGVDDLMGTLRSEAKSIISFFDSASSWLYSAGQNVVYGFASGIKSAVGSVTSALGNIAGSAVGTVKNLLGIRSPSRVFMEIGGFVSQGLGQGILNSQDYATVAAKRLGAATANAGATAIPGLQVGSPTGGGSSNGQTMANSRDSSGGITINISVGNYAGSDSELRIFGQKIYQALQQQARANGFHGALPNIGVSPLG